MNKHSSFLFLGKANDEFAQQAAQFLATHFPNVEAHFGGRGQPFPTTRGPDGYDYVFSYLCQWVVPEAVLYKARIAAINFHPGPPNYPGIGCTNFAIYDGVSEFGVTCHHMARRVDSGQIIQVRRFPVTATDTVFSLTQRCYAYIAVLFYEIVDLIRFEKNLPKTAEHWSRAPYRRRDFEDLLRLTRDMPADEVSRRIRATTYPGYPCAQFEPVS
jgi:methionyl-tRNA formyltransferase